LIETYGRLLDEDRLEDWLDLFAETCRYQIVSRENRAQNLPLSLMLCDNKDMLRDRIYSLRHANIFNIHSDCHVIGLVRTTPAADGRLAASAAYSLFQSTQEGESRLFSVGRYHFELLNGEAGLLIETLLVVVDTGTIPTLLATPI
jgi:anthranilate 1,2-dioxygenase small subunit